MVKIRKQEMPNTTRLSSKQQRDRRKQFCKTILPPVHIVLGDLCPPLDREDGPHIHSLVLVPDCLGVAYATASEYFCQSEINFILTSDNLCDMIAVLTQTPCPFRSTRIEFTSIIPLTCSTLVNEFLMVLFCALVQILLRPFQIEKQQIEIDKAQHLLLGVSVSKTTAIPNEVDQESPELKHH